MHEGMPDTRTPCVVFFINDTPTSAIYTLSLHDALPISIAVSPRLRPEYAYDPSAKPVSLNPASAVSRWLTAAGAGGSGFGGALSAGADPACAPRARLANRQAPTNAARVRRPAQ